MLKVGTHVAYQDKQALIPGIVVAVRHRDRIIPGQGVVKEQAFTVGLFRASGYHVVNATEGTGKGQVSASEAPTPQPAPTPEPEPAES